MATSVQDAWKDRTYYAGADWNDMRPDLVQLYVPLDEYGAAVDDYNHDCWRGHRADACGAEGPAAQPGLHGGQQHLRPPAPRLEGRVGPLPLGREGPPYRVSVPPAGEGGGWRP
eukprot:5714800-Pyramimonas_sp.AAC.1